MAKKTTAWTDEERAEMAQQRHDAAVAGGAYEMGADGKPLRVALGTPDAPNAIGEVSAELARARAKFPGAQNSAHEGYAVLAEEVDELWDEVKANHPDRKARMRAEAIQVAAMAIRFIEDVCDGKA